MSPAGRARRLLSWLVAALTGAVLAVAGLALAAAPAHACSCAPFALDRQVSSADGVVAGTVTALDKQPDPGTGTIRLSVDTDRWWKGTPRDGVQVVTAESSAACGLGRLPVGERYVFFLTESNGTLYADSCGGTGRATPTLLGGVEGVAGAGVEPDRPDPADRPRDGADETRGADLVRVADDEPYGVWAAVAPGGLLVAVGLLGLLLLPLLRRRRG